MKPKVQIEIGKWTAIILLIGALLQMLVVLFVFRNSISNPIMLHGLVMPIVFSNILALILFAGFAVVFSHRLFKTSLILLICYIFLVARAFFRAALDDLLPLLFELFFLFVLSQAVFGLYRQRRMTSK